MNSCNTDIFFSNYYNLQSVHFEFIIMNGLFAKDYSNLSNGICFICRLLAARVKVNSQSLVKKPKLKPKRKRSSQLPSTQQQKQQ